MKKTKNRRRKEVSSTELEKGLGLMGLVFLMAFILAGVSLGLKIFPIISEKSKMDMALEYVSESPGACLLYTSPSPRDKRQSRMPSSA